jgi:hypothetical protein
MRNRMIVNLSLCLLLLASAACGGQLYKVAPLPTTAPPDLPPDGASGINIGYTRLNGDLALERFEANLPLAGVIAVDVRVANNTEATIKPGSLKFELRDTSSVKLGMLTPKKALGSVMKFYGNSFYTKSAYGRTLSDYESVALKLDRAIEPKEERRGVLFFQTKRNTTTVDGLTLSVAGPIETLNVRIRPAQ